MRTCRPGQPLPAAARPPAQRRRAPHAHPLNRKRTQKRLPASELMLRRAPSKLHQRPHRHAPRPQAEEPAPRQRLARARLLLQRPPHQKGRQHAVRRHLNSRLPVRRWRPHHAAQSLHSQRVLRKAAHPPSRRTDSPREAQPRSEVGLLHRQPGPRSPLHRGSAQVSRSVVERRLSPDSGRSRAATASALATEDMERPDAPPLAGRRDTPEGHARPHQRSGRRSGASTWSKRRSRAPFPSRRR
jgi:hypothetical protein